MATTNRSPSYNRDREKVRRWLSRTREGQYAIEIFKNIDSARNISNTLEDDRWVDWADVMREHRHDLQIAADCAEHRNAVDLARQSKSNMGAPTSAGSKLMRFFSPPIWYVLRRQVEMGDPSYWNHPKTVLDEALRNPQWCVVPRRYIVSARDALMPKTREKIIVGAA